MATLPLARIKCKASEETTGLSEGGCLPGLLLKENKHDE